MRPAARCQIRRPRPSIQRREESEKEDVGAYRRFCGKLGNKSTQLVGSVVAHRQVKWEDDGFGAVQGVNPTSTTDYGLQLGAGVRVFKNITAELRYSLGLGYMESGDKAGSFRNNALGLTVGYAFQ